VGVEIVKTCGSLDWQALGASSSGNHAGLRVVCFGECSPGGAEEWAQGSEICQPVDQWLHMPMERGLVYSTSCSFSKSWCREAFHELGVQSADVSALPHALPQPSMSPVSLQSPLFTELMQCTAVS
jgi:hypothetical protein